jgi:hypothetical protein
MDTTEERRHYRGGLVWPVILISAGVVFLLNNLGVLSWNVWGTLWRLWPVLLIAIGLDILFGRRSLLGSLVVALLLVVVLVAAIGLGVPQLGVPQWSLGSLGSLSGLDAVERTETIDESLRGADRADVEIGFGTGSLRLGALPEGSSELIKGTVDLGHNERLTLDHGSSGSLSLRSRNAGITGFNTAQDNSKVWDLELNRDVPMQLKVGTGVGSSTLDLTRLNLTGLEIDSGVGQTSVTLPERGRFTAKVDSGLGEVTIIVPQAMAARIRVDRGLSGVSVNGDFNRRDDEYVSPNYGTAANRMDLDVSSGLGRIVIRQVVEE